MDGVPTRMVPEPMAMDDAPPPDEAMIDLSEEMPCMGEEAPEGDLGMMVDDPGMEVAARQFAATSIRQILTRAPMPLRGGGLRFAFLEHSLPRRLQTARPDPDCPKA
ncbi:MAG: hypothetical protein HN742_12750 [Lentisphaerae bacterium]|jgi:hypothetical protein|nr:hypothetical protein [Lentisphaerota bacterium]MBT5607382.1 hypothetical protein [Lentisphaerota bacterium]MBT7057812.1 hypothetical protein [Lentisphaerota bacterium]MBT7842738.1 hypothetical protein [Lentisphaerota bacterium]